MRYCSILIFIFIFSGNSFAKRIRYTNIFLYPNAISFSTFPTIENALSYKIRVGMVWLTVSGHLWPFDNENNFDDFIFPYSFYDSSITYRTKVNKFQSRAGIKTGVEFRIPSILKKRMGIWGLF